MTHEEDLKMLQAEIERKKISNTDPVLIVERFKTDVKIHFKYLRFGLFADEGIDAKHGLKTIAYDLFMEALNEYIEEQGL